VEPASVPVQSIVPDPSPVFETLQLRTLAQLDVAAASGIALRDASLYVIADDELDLAVYSCGGVRTQSILLRAGTLPIDPVERKAAKPDFEALLTLPDGSLLALGSGSTARRTRGAWICFGQAGATVHEIDLAALYARLTRQHPELNIEGGAVLGEALWLCSRGNGSLHDNALIRLDLRRVCDTLARERALSVDCLVSTQPVSLPQLEGTPLSLTDLALAGDRLLFAAAAEASANTYDDGACVGSVLGRLNLAGEVQGPLRMTARLKIEGVCTRPIERGLGLFLVADADDPQAHAPLMAAEWPAD
jgi:hypothetical protein